MFKSKQGRLMSWERNVGFIVFVGRVLIGCPSNYYKNIASTKNVLYQIGYNFTSKKDSEFENANRFQTFF